MNACLIFADGSKVNVNASFRLAAGCEIGLSAMYPIFVANSLRIIPSLTCDT